LVKNLCLVIDDEPGILRFVKTGLSDGINVEIKSGLAMEDKIKKPSASLK